jgi:hypothetical protein
VGLAAKFAPSLISLTLLALWTLVTVRAVCWPCSTSTRTLRAFLLLGLLIGTVALPLVPAVVAPHASYNQLREEQPLLFAFAETLKVGLPVLPVGYLVFNSSGTARLPVGSAFLMAFLLGFGADLASYTLIAAAGLPGQAAALTWLPPWQSIAGRSTIAGYSYWAGLTAIALAAADRFLRSRRVVIAVGAIALGYVTIDALANTGSYARPLFGGQLTAWVVLAAAAVFSALDLPSERPEPPAAHIAWRPAPDVLVSWLLLAFFVTLVPRLSQPLQASIWSVWLIRIGPAFMPPIVIVALLVVVLTRYLVVTQGRSKKPHDGGLTLPPSTLASFPETVVMKTAVLLSLAAGAIVLFGVLVSDAYPYAFVQRTFREVQLKSLIVLLAVAVTGSLAPPLHAMSGDWPTAIRMTWQRERRQVIALATGVVSAWLGVKFYGLASNMMLSTLGREWIGLAASLAAVGGAAVSFAATVAVNYLRQGGRSPLRLPAWARRRQPAEFTDTSPPR